MPDASLSARSSPVLASATMKSIRRLAAFVYTRGYVGAGLVTYRQPHGLYCRVCSTSACRMRLTRLTSSSSGLPAAAGGRDQSVQGTSSSLATVDVNKPQDWCLPNAVHQQFTGLIWSGAGGIMPGGKWEGDHW